MGFFGNNIKTPEGKLLNRLESPEERKRRLISLYITHFSMFLSGFGNAIIYIGMFPYIQAVSFLFIRNNNLSKDRLKETIAPIICFLSSAGAGGFTVQVRNRGGCWCYSSDASLPSLWADHRQVNVRLLTASQYNVPVMTSGPRPWFRSVCFAHWCSLVATCSTLCWAPCPGLTTSWGSGWCWWPGS